MFKGVMVSAMAAYVNRDIHLVGTANIGKKSHYSKIEANTSHASRNAPLTLGYLQDIHFQSLVNINYNFFDILLIGSKV